MSSGPVLYDVAGPEAKRRERTISLVLGAVLVAAAAFIILQLYRNDVFNDRWLVLVDVPMNFAGYETANVWAAVGRGLMNTLLAAVIALPLAALLAVILVSARSSRIAPLRWLVTACIEVFRGLPVVLMMFFAVLVLPMQELASAVSRVLPFEFVSPALFAVVFGLTVYNGAVFAEILRAGINALPKGQTEAAESLGMGSLMIYRSIQLPQAVRMMLPSLIAQGVVLVKDSSLGYIVSYAELLRSISRVADSLTNAQYLLPLLAVGATVFVTVNVLLSRLAVWVQRRSGRRRPMRMPAGAPVPVDD